MGIPTVDSWFSFRYSAPFVLLVTHTKVAELSANAIEPVIFGPNITGTMVQGITNRGDGSSSACMTDNLSGAFSSLLSSPRPYYTSVGTTSVSLNYGLALNASTANALYGNSSSVQPPARQALMIIRA